MIKHQISKIDKLSNIINRFAARSKYYEGVSLEEGGTSRAGEVSPAIMYLFNSGVFVSGDKVIDYGAGKYARNANFLRNQGIDVFAYDPYNGGSGDGWLKISSTLPKGEYFNVGFTCYVLNVVPKKIEQKIISELSSICGVSYHTVRNDIFDFVKRALLAKKEPIVSFFINNFASADEINDLEEGNLSNNVIMEFCEFGVQTSKGFQRLTVLEKEGASLILKNKSYKIYRI